MPTIEIFQVRNVADIGAATELAWEFIALLRERYPELVEVIETYLVDRDFEGKL